MKNQEKDLIELSGHSDLEVTVDRGRRYEGDGYLAENMKSSSSLEFTPGKWGADTQIEIENLEAIRKVGQGDKKSKEKEPVDFYSLLSELTEKVPLFRVERDALFVFGGDIWRKVSDLEFAEIVQQYIPERKLRKFGGMKKLKELYETALTSPKLRKISELELEKDRYKVAFQNGIYDAITGKMEYGFSPEYMVFHKLDVNYGSSYVYDGHTVADKFFWDIADGDEVVIEMLWEFLAYIMLPTCEAKCFFVMADAPDSGKSKFLEFVRASYAKGTVSDVSPHKLGGKFATACLVDAKVNVSMDLSSEPLDAKAVAEIKLLTGESTVEVERKFENAKSARVHCKLVFGTNSPVQIMKHDEAFWNRMLIIPFLKSIPKNQQNRQLMEQLVSERDYIWTRAAMTAHELLHRNFAFSVSESAIVMKKQWRGNSDDGVCTFLEEYCERTDNKCFWVVSEAYELYVEYAQENGFEEITKKVFSERVRKRMQLPPKYQQNIDGVTKKVFFGLRIRNDKEIKAVPYCD